MLCIYNEHASHAQWRKYVSLAPKDILENSKVGYTYTDACCQNVNITSLVIRGRYTMFGNIADPFVLFGKEARSEAWSSLYTESLPFLRWGVGGCYGSVPA